MRRMDFATVCTELKGDGARGSSGIIYLNRYVCVYIYADIYIYIYIYEYSLIYIYTNTHLYMYI